LGLVGLLVVDPEIAVRIDVVVDRHAGGGNGVAQEVEVVFAVTVEVHNADDRERFAAARAPQGRVERVALAARSGNHFVENWSFRQVGFEDSRAFDRALDVFAADLALLRAAADPRVRLAIDAESRPGLQAVGRAQADPDLAADGVDPADPAVGNFPAHARL